MLEQQTKQTEKSVKTVSKTQDTETLTTASPKIVWKDKRSFRHDLFKLEPAVMKQNVSWKKDEPMLQDVTHAHIYHSHSSSGIANRTSQAMGGHFHEVKVSVDTDGNLKATCGPPLRIVEKMLKTGGVRKVEEPLEWFHEKLNKKIVDDHRHECTYQFSETISPEKSRAQATEDAQKLRMLMGNQLQPKTE